jgi:hypothetical protein
VLVISLIAYFIAYFTFQDLQGVLAIGGRSVLFITIFITATYYRNISPDLIPIIEQIKKRIRIK